MKMTSEQLIEKALSLNYELRELLSEIVEQEDSLVDNLSLNMLCNSDAITSDINNDLVILQNNIK